MSMSEAKRHVEAARDGTLGVSVALVTAYVGAFVAAELVLAFGDILVGVAVHAAICLVAIHHRLAIDRRAAGDADRHRPTPALSAFLLCLSLASVTRICVVALPLGDVSQAVWPAIAALPMLVGVNSVRRAGMSGNWEGRGWFSLQRWPRELLLAVAGVPLGLLGYVAVRPEALLVDPHVDADTIVMIGSLLLLACGEEMIYRGLVQPSLVSVLGRSGVPVAALLVAATTLGDRSWTAFLFVLAMGIGYGAVVRRTGCLVGVVLAHWLVLVGTLGIWPGVL